MASMTIDRLIINIPSSCKPRHKNSSGPGLILKRLDTFFHYAIIRSELLPLQSSCLGERHGKEI